MKIQAKLQKPLSVKIKFWLTYILTIFFALTFSALLYYFPKYQFLIVLLLSLAVIIDAALISFFQLAKNRIDSKMGAIIFFVLGLLGVVYSILIWMQFLVSNVPIYMMMPIAFPPALLTSQIIQRLLEKNN